MNPLRSLLAVGLALTLITITAHALTLPVSEDTSTTTNLKLAKAAGNATTLPVTETRSGLVRFEVSAFSAEIAAANVTRARLVLYFSKVSKPGALTVNRVTEDWSETVTSAPVVVPAFDATALATIPAESVVSKQFIVIDVTDTVKAWLAATTPDFGLAIVSDGTAKVSLGAKEGPAAGYAATLQIEAGQSDAASIGAGVVSNAEFNALDGVTSAIQTQLDGKLATSGGTLTGELNVSTAFKVEARPNNTGLGNLFVGADAGSANTTGNANTASGSTALRANTTGNANTATGVDALTSNTTGSENTAHGAYALYNNTTASNNTAVGNLALFSNTTGASNSAFGRAALYVNSTGINNTASGASALFNNTTGIDNTASGVSTLRSNTTGSFNTAVGSSALLASTVGVSNTAIGRSTLAGNTVGNDNTASGSAALRDNTTGNANTAFGTVALLANTTGSFNTALGRGAGINLTTGSNNIFIGNGGEAVESNTIRLGTEGIQTRAFVAGVRGVIPGIADGVPVLIDSAGQLGIGVSSRRYKEDIADMGDTSARLQALRPVTFRYARPFDNGEQPIQFGLIAEEVAETFPELAVFNSLGQPETVKYHDLAPLLLNEVQKLMTENDALKKQLAERDARDRQRDERIGRLESLLSPAPGAAAK